MEFQPIPKTLGHAPLKQYYPPTSHPHASRPTRPIRSPLHLTPQQVEEFHETGVLRIPSAQAWTSREQKLILDSVNMMEEWADAPGKYTKIYEKKRVNGIATDEEILLRIENFCPYNPGLDYILQGEKMLNMIGDLFQEEGILYKEKINYKRPGGDGFVPHQDVAAGWWMYGQSLHISTLICIDPATRENGCLEVSRGEHLKGMRSEPWKELPSDVADGLKWEPCLTQPGDVVFFDSFVPHRSAPNTTSTSRRVVYATYAKAVEGNFRERYYADMSVSYPPFFPSFMISSPHQQAGRWITSTTREDQDNTEIETETQNAA